MNQRTAKLLFRVASRKRMNRMGLKELKRRWNLVPRPLRAGERQLLEEAYPK